MQIIRDLEATPAALKGAVVAIGNFDGVHVGHRALIAQGQKLASASGRPFAILTFEPHPRRIFQPDAAPVKLTTFSDKARLLREIGVDAVFVQRFSRTFANLSAEEFISKILRDQLGASHIITGEEFVFGKGRAGNAETLKDWAKKDAFAYTAYKPVEASAEKISSTRIRAHLAAGECEVAEKLLGRPYAITGRVIHGDKRGRSLGFPTANLALCNRFLPKFGVYAVKVTLCSPLRGEQMSVDFSAKSTANRGGEKDHHPSRIASESYTIPFSATPPSRWSERTYDGVANLGVRPMYKAATPLLETYLFDFSGDIYGKRVRVELVKYLREEQKFASEAALISAMNEDTKQAQAILKQYESQA